MLRIIDGYIYLRYTLSDFWDMLGCVIHNSHKPGFHAIEMRSTTLAKIFDWVVDVLGSCCIVSSGPSLGALEPSAEHNCSKLTEITRRTLSTNKPSPSVSNSTLALQWHGLSHSLVSALVFELHVYYFQPCEGERLGCKLQRDQINSTHSCEFCVAS
jgi:hypothetical protein